jgi:hypothetical protein
LKGLTSVRKGNADCNIQSVDEQKITNARMYRLENENPARPVKYFQFLLPDAAAISGRLHKLCRHEIVQRAISLARLSLYFSEIRQQILFLLLLLGIMTPLL